MEIWVNRQYQIRPLTPETGVRNPYGAPLKISKEIATLVGISRRTVEFHRANLLRNIGAKNTAELVRKVLSQ